MEALQAQAPMPSPLSLSSVGALSLLSATALAQIPPIVPWSTQTFKSEPTLIPPALSFDKQGETAPGYLLFSPAGQQKQNASMIMTDVGDLVWQTAPMDATNLELQSLHGKPVLTYWTGVDVTSIGVGYGNAIILDDTYSIIHNVTLDDDIVAINGETFPSYVDAHEQNLMDNGTLLVTVYNATTGDLSSVGGPANGWIVDALVYGIDVSNNKVVFRWRSSDHLDKLPLTDSKVTPSATFGTGTSATEAFDYFHINAIQPFEGGYLLSSRHLCSGIYIAGNGSVQWRVDGISGGDFALGPGAGFAWQHDIRVERTSKTTLRMHMHNNENNAFGQMTPTTGLFLNLDFTAKTATEIIAYSDPNSPVASFAEGSLQPLPNGNVFMGYGSAAKLKEFAASGAIVYNATFGNVLTTSYRASRMLWKGYPTQAPAIVACALNSTSTAVYVSWNGATEYTAWNVYVGKTSTKLSLAGKFARTGFETEAIVPTTSFVQAKAVGQSGNNKSAIVTVASSC